MDRSNEQLRLLRLAQSGDTAAKEQLIRDNQALVWSIVKRYTGRGTEAEDLFQLGSIGLFKAIEGFDCTYGTRFSTYAVPKISGEIRRFLRDDGAMKVSRSVKELGYRVHTARETLHQTLSRPPTIHEIANWLEVSPEEIAACETALLPPDSLQREIGEDGTTLEQMLGEACMEERVVESLALPRSHGAIECSVAAHFAAAIFSRADPAGVCAAARYFSSTGVAAGKKGGAAAAKMAGARVDME